MDFIKGRYLINMSTNRVYCAQNANDVYFILKNESQKVGGN